MRRFNFAASLVALGILALAGCDGGDVSQTTTGTTIAPAGKAASRADDARRGSGFDFYVLALSWSPSYCASEGADANRQQCGTGRPYSFIVHGLWPQFERGYPADCDTNERDVPRNLAQSLYDIMPSNGLIRQQWRKHGSCAGMPQQEYFEVVRAARSRVTIPNEYIRPAAYRTVNPGEVERAFQRVNPGLDADAITTSCGGRYFDEVRICMTKDLQFRSCPEVDRRACRKMQTVMPPVRGGG